MKVFFKTIEFIFFRLTIFLLVALFKAINYVVFNLLDIFYSAIFFLDNIISRICFKIYFQYIQRFLRYLCSLSLCLLPSLKNTCRNYFLKQLLKVKHWFTCSKTNSLKTKTIKFSYINKNKNIINKYKSDLFNCIVKRAC